MSRIFVICGYSQGNGKGQGDADQAPFSKRTLVAFRQRLIGTQMDRRLIERIIEVASQNQAFGPLPPWTAAHCGGG